MNLIERVMYVIALICLIVGHITLFVSLITLFINIDVAFMLFGCTILCFLVVAIFQTIYMGTENPYF